MRAGKFRRKKDSLFIHRTGLPSLFASTDFALGRPQVDVRWQLQSASPATRVRSGQAVSLYPTRNYRVVALAE